MGMDVMYCAFQPERNHSVVIVCLNCFSLQHKSDICFFLVQLFHLSNVLDSSSSRKVQLQKSEDKRIALVAGM